MKATLSTAANGHRMLCVDQPDSATWQRLQSLLEQELGFAREGQLLARISHTSPTAAAARFDKNGRGVARCAPSSPLDVVSTTPARSSSPRTAPHHVLDGLATDRYEKCGLAGLDEGLLPDFVSDAIRLHAGWDHWSGAYLLASCAAGDRLLADLAQRLDGKS